MVVQGFTGGGQVLTGNYFEIAAREISEARGQRESCGRRGGADIGAGQGPRPALPRAIRCAAPRCVRQIHMNLEAVHF